MDSISKKYYCQSTQILLEGMKENSLISRLVKVVLLLHLVLTNVHIFGLKLSLSASCA